MGIIRSGIYDKSTLFLKKAGNINHFVETGTYYGNTSLWAAEHFDSVETIEFCEEIFQEAQNKLKNYKEVTILKLIDMSDNEKKEIQINQQLNKKRKFENKNGETTHKSFNYYY